MGIASAAKARGEDQDRRRRRRPDLGGLQLQNEPHRGADARAGGGPVMVRRAAARLPARPPACLLACLDLGLDGRCIVSRTCPAASLGRPHEPRPRRWPRPVLCSRDEYRADTAPPRPAPCSFVAVSADACTECTITDGEGTCPRGCTIPGDLGITGAMRLPLHQAVSADLAASNARMSPLRDVGWQC
jgi:hypothetical protein